jgi:hypothetical protein
VLCEELTAAQSELEAESENYAKALAEPGKPSSWAESEAMRAKRDQAYSHFSKIRTELEKLQEANPTIEAIHNAVEGLSTVSCELSRDWWIQTMKDNYGCKLQPKKRAYFT